VDKDAARKPNRFILSNVAHNYNITQLKTNFSLLIFLIWINFSFGQTETDALSSLNWCSEIELNHTDDKCGEWGGDSETIFVFQKDCKGDFYIEYKKRIMNCKDDPIIHYQRKDFDKEKTVLLTKEDRILVELCIKELTEMKLSNPNVIAHSGIENKVTLSDSTLVIKDYPSKKWLAFNRLKKHILER
jgi:hypothetical protein